MILINLTKIPGGGGGFQNQTMYTIWCTCVYGGGGVPFLCLIFAQEIKAEQVKV